MERPCRSARVSAPAGRAAWLFVVLVLAACRGQQTDGVGASDRVIAHDRRPLRGVVLVSVDTLRADNLGAYGYPRDTSPRLDQLAAQSVVFERAIAQAPSTLTSHLAMFTSLFPPQFFATAEAPVPPEGHVLAETIATFPQLFRAAGFRTAGHSEGGYVSGHYGFSRGFDEWTDTPYRQSSDIEATVQRGLDFLRGMAASDERFLLFLHTYSVHDSYEPPEPERHMFWPGEPATLDPPSARTLEASNAGRRPTSQRESEYFAARYDGGIRYADRVLGRLWDAIDTLGFGDEVVVAVTSDHGEEFQEHGRYLHTQLYPEHLHVPLIVRVPGTAPRRVGRPVRSIDIAPTLLELAGLGPLPSASGRSLMSLFGGGETVDEAADTAEQDPVYAETWHHDVQLTMRLTKVGGAWYWLVREAARSDPAGVWVSRAKEFDVEATVRRLGLRLLAFHEPRQVRVLDASGGALDGEPVLAVDAIGWSDHQLRLAESPTAGFHRLRLEVDGCVSPFQVGAGDDRRCLGVQVAAPPLVVHRAFDLAADPRARHELATGELLRRALVVGLERCRWQTLAAPGASKLSAEQRKALESLGYL